MKALIWKELREQRVLAGLAFLTLIVFLLFNGFEAVNDAQLTASEKGGSSIHLQPLLSDDFQVHLAIVCGLFGTVLGWMQMFNERHRDLWAFLIHRPVTAPTIFRAKVATGLLLYLTAIGLPLLCFVLWIAFSGQVAAPFEWPMVLPSLAYAVAGLVCYFAAMLLCLRPVRWYGSRIWPVGVPVIVYLCCGILPAFWQAALAVLIGIGVTALAAQGVFCHRESFSSQPPSSKAGLAFTLVAGAAIIWAFCAAMLSSVATRSEDHESIYYQMGREGTIYKIVRKGPATKVTDLEGNPVIDRNSGQTIQHVHQSLNVAPAWGLTTSRIDEENRASAPPFQSGYSYFTFWKAGSGILWYHWHKHGRIVGFDAQSGKIVGSIGPDGFSQGQVSGARFEGLEHRNRWFAPTVMWTKDAVYSIDTQKMTGQPVIKTSQGETVLDAVKAQTTEGARYTTAVTGKSVYLMDPDGKILWDVPFGLDPKDYSRIYIHPLDAPGKFAMSFNPSYVRNKALDGKLTTHYLWVETGKGVTRQQEVPSFLHKEYAPSLKSSLIMGTTPLILLPLERSLKVLLPYALGYGVICMLVGLWLTRRHRLSLGTQVTWTAWLLLTGVPGLLAFLGAQDWPKREKCTTCGKPRSVEQEQCAHCHEGFPAPEKNGVEIFETVTAE